MKKIVVLQNVERFLFFIIVLYNLGSKRWDLDLSLLGLGYKKNAGRWDTKVFMVLMCGFVFVYDIYLYGIQFNDKNRHTLAVLSARNEGTVNRYVYG